MISKVKKQPLPVSSESGTGLSACLGSLVAHTAGVNKAIGQLQCAS